MSHLFSFFFALFLGFGLYDSFRKEPDLNTSTAIERVIRIVFWRILALFLCSQVLSEIFSFVFIESYASLHWIFSKGGVFEMLQLFAMVVAAVMVFGASIAIIFAVMTALIAFLFSSWRKEVFYSVAVVTATAQVHFFFYMWQVDSLR